MLPAMPAAPNPLVRDRDVDFLLHELLNVEELTALPYFADHGRETFDLFLASTRRLARTVLYPAYRPMDQEPPVFEGGKVRVHPRMKELYRAMISLGLGNAARPASVGGQQLPLTVSTLASAYLMAANLSAYGFVGLTAGAAHLIEAFGDETLKRELMTPLYSGEWTGTMALTEPGAGSSLADVSTRAVPAPDGTYRLKGSKIFISGGDHDLTDNIVHMTLARIEDAPPGIKGVSLFAVPKNRSEGGKLVSNDVTVAGAIHKIGWRGLPSVVLELGDHGDCHGHLVGEPNRGIAYMFQMMNEARLMVGVNGVATASVAYHESLAYASERTQGRPAGAKDPRSPQVPLIHHADVRRMLLRQKAIVEGGLALIAVSAREADLAAHATSAEERHRAHLFLDMLTPIAKSFPAERGFESNALALQIHGGYGYSSEAMPEAWLRDQKLNTIHEGTTGIQSMDLLGRKVVAEGGAPLRILNDEIDAARQRAKTAGLPRAHCDALDDAMRNLERVTSTLAGLGIGGDVEGMLRHSVDYLHMTSIVVVAWIWLRQATVAKEALARGGADRDFYEGKLHAAQYWFATELPEVPVLAERCLAGDDAYATMRPEQFLESSLRSSSLPQPVTRGVPHGRRHSHRQFHLAGRTPLHPRSALRDRGDRGRGGHLAHLGDGPLVPDGNDGRGDDGDDGGVHHARLHRGQDEEGAHRDAGHRRHVPAPGSPGEDRDHAGRALGRACGARHRCGLVRA
jgi:alkylation response protein AidB-like acyl-CoA dehydrogenase